MPRKPGGKRPAKHVLRLPDLDHSKTSVLQSLGSVASKRTYAYAINDFITWYWSEPRLAFGRTVPSVPLRAGGQTACSCDHQPEAGGSAPPRLRGFRQRPAQPRPRSEHQAREGREEVWVPGSETGSRVLKGARFSTLPTGAKQKAKEIMPFWPSCWAAACGVPS